MRPDPFDQPEWSRLRYNHAPADARDPVPERPAERAPLPAFDDWHLGDSSGDGPPPVQPPLPRRRWGRWIMRGFGAAIILFVILVAWLAVTAPLSRSLKPPTPPSITLTAEDGTPIARRGAIIGAPVEAAKLPAHVREAFLAIEDRRFYSHWGIDPRGIARAAWHNMRGGGVREGGSTITQQLAKNAFLDSDRTAARKIREMMISFWLEAWLTKDEILSRYLSNVYFGDNVYGIRAAAKHYFGRAPEDLNIGQAAMLAGLVKAPSRLAPTGNLKGARAREAVVVGAMVAAGFLTEAEADRVQPQRVLPDQPNRLPNGTYFADWVLPSARDQAGEIKTETTVQTTLDRKMQRAAERAVRRAGLKQAQVALVAMRPDGRVVAMVGGKDYSKSPFNRATQARRQPGSTFKLFVYLAAMRAGLTPDSTVEDRPVEISGWKPRNSDGKYLGAITLREAFARSSNVAAARLTQQVGVRAVIKAARDLGISTPIPEETTIALGTSTVSLLELTAAYGAIARGSYPVAPRGLEQVQDKSWYESFTSRPTTIPDHIRAEMLDLMSASVSGGTSRQAGLSVDTFGKTGTTQDNRDALFMGFANGIVAGVWVGNDDNTPNPGLSGGGIPARIWRDFMTEALGLTPAARPAAIPAADAEDQGDAVGDLIDDSVGDLVNGQIAPIQGQLEGMGLNLRMGDDGSFSVSPSRERNEAPPRRDDRRPSDEQPDYDQQ